MQSWPSEHVTEFRKLFDRGYTYPVIAASLNEVFPGAEYTDAACRGQAQRLGLTNGKRRESTLTEKRYEHLRVEGVRENDRVLEFCDLQTPYHDPVAVAAFLRFARDFAPHYLVANGDNFDFYEVSDFSKSPARRRDFQEEVDHGRAVLDRIEEATHGAQKFWIDGNHEQRLLRWLWKNAPQLSHLRSLDPRVLLGLDDWEYLQYGSRLDILGVLFEHGDKVSSDAGATARNMMRKRGSSGVSGHTHRFATVTHRDAHRDYTWIESGCLCKLELEYGPAPDWQHGFTYGIVKNGRLHLTGVPMYEDGTFRAEGQWYHGRGAKK